MSYTHTKDRRGSNRERAQATEQRRFAHLSAAGIPEAERPLLLRQWRKTIASGEKIGLTDFAKRRVAATRQAATPAVRRGAQLDAAFVAVFGEAAKGQTRADQLRDASSEQVRKYYERIAPHGIRRPVR